MELFDQRQAALEKLESSWRTCPCAHCGLRRKKAEILRYGHSNAKKFCYESKILVAEKFNLRTGNFEPDYIRSVKRWFKELGDKECLGSDVVVSIPADKVGEWDLWLNPWPSTSSEIIN